MRRPNRGKRRCDEGFREIAAGVRVAPLQRAAVGTGWEQATVMEGVRGL